jgi:D-alanyl-D-alanine dipeptidase
MCFLWLIVLLGADPILVDASTLNPRFVVDIKYATTDNFMGQILYPVGRCLLRPEVATRLQSAQRYLDEHHKGFTLMLKDCYRPRSVQVRMWEKVKGTDKQSYVANPKGGSVHNFGAAVDLTLVDADGAEVDMGTPYDFFGDLAQPRHEEEFLAKGSLTPAQVEHRKILRQAMVHAGFKSIPNEWWHFDALQGKALRAKYKILDIPLDAVDLAAPKP